ncbi:Mov34/MPN/PAD-1 family protein [Diaporthe helianthi]|uniref:Mov34/MPN/PAD-1 family protein n=1 Tax=Diaporthe helianthi TaxID=158607 RepID=A0A2P5I1X0_DIAHE|nr:Mov34/MPN/PAD-1 family protein [Diaporthe helianthi]
MNTTWALPDRPLSVKEIDAEAKKFEFNILVGLKQWLRAADTLLRQGNMYAREGNASQAYLLLLRYSTLILDHLPKHPEAKTLDGKRAVKHLAAGLGKVFETLEHLKPQIKDAHDEWVKIHVNQPDGSTKLEGERSPYEIQAARDPALSWNPKVRAKLLDAGEHQDLAVDLARREIRRRDAARKATRQAGISEEEEQARRGAGLWDDWDAPAPRDEMGAARDDGDDIRRNMDAARRTLDQTERAARPPSSGGSYPSRPSSYSTYDRRSSYQYPSISRSSVPQYPPPINDPHSGRHPRPPHPPPRPAKEPSSQPSYEPHSAPPRPNKEPVDSFGSAHEASPTIGQPRPLELPPKSMDRKERYTFRPAAYLENGTPIRPVFLPDRLRHEFLTIASQNTRKGLEMCGILCGTSVNNALFISTLIIPKQTCTTDTCETDNEEEVIEFCMREDLMVFGWIHTHPTQTCFMSSRDLHTQSGYQVMMPESIAIVCAPRSDPSYGIFRLTNPPGLDHILHCTQSSTFHQHSINGLYTDAKHPGGHVYHSNQLDFHIEDLRQPSRI